MKYICDKNNYFECQRMFFKKNIYWVGDKFGELFYIYNKFKEVKDNDKIVIYTQYDDFNQTVIIWAELKEYINRFGNKNLLIFHNREDKLKRILK